MTLLAHLNTSTFKCKIKFQLQFLNLVENVSFKDFLATLESTEKTELLTVSCLSSIFLDQYKRVIYGKTLLRLLPSLIPFFFLESWAPFSTPK